MKKEQIFETIKKIITEKEYSDIEINLDTPIIDGGLSLSSLDAIDLIVSIEDYYHIQFPDEYLNVTLLSNIEILVNTVETLL